MKNALILALVAALSGAAAFGGVRPALVPAPAKVAWEDGAFTLDAKTVLLTDGSPEARAVANLLAPTLRTSTGYPLKIRLRGKAPERNAIILALDAGAAPEVTSPLRVEEGYILEISRESARLRAPRRAGLFYAAQTFRQLLPPAIESRSRVKGVAWAAPTGRIEDAPRFVHRGFLVDSSRHIQTLDFLKRTLDRMAYHKMNVFHWHLTDDPGWRLEIRRYPRLTRVGAWRTEPDGARYGGFYTQAQVRDLVRYAAERNITIIPEIEMPGHSAGAVAAYPELSCRPGDPHRVLRVAEGIISVCPGKEGTEVFFQNVLSEVMELFPSRVVHIGGDEVDKAPWRACPDCQAAIRRENLKDEKELQHHFIQRIASFLASKGRRTQGWNEIMEGGGLPEGVVLQQWNDPGSGAVAARAGNDVVVSPIAWAYLDYSYETTPLKSVYEAEVIPRGLTPAQERHILGPQGNLWTEWLQNDARADDLTWPRLIAVAEVGWSPQGARQWEGFAERLRTAHFERLALMGLGVAGETPESIRARLMERFGLPASSAPEPQ